MERRLSRHILLAYVLCAVACLAGCSSVLHISMGLLRCSHYTTAVLQVAELAAVWVSHRHADHMAGLPGILAARSSAKPPLLVSCVIQKEVLP